MYKKKSRVVYLAGAILLVLLVGVLLSASSRIHRSKIADLKYDGRFLEEQLMLPGAPSVRLKYPYSWGSLAQSSFTGPDFLQGTNTLVKNFVGFHDEYHAASIELHKYQLPLADDTCFVEEGGCIGGLRARDKQDALSLFEQIYDRKELPSRFKETIEGSPFFHQYEGKYVIFQLRYEENETGSLRGFSFLLDGGNGVQLNLYHVTFLFSPKERLILALSFPLSGLPELDFPGSENFSSQMLVKHYEYLENMPNKRSPLAEILKQIDGVVFMVKILREK